MSLRSATGDENVSGKILRFTARNDSLCHLEPFDELRVNSVRDLFLVLFSKEFTKITKGEKIILTRIVFL